MSEKSENFVVTKSSVLPACGDSDSQRRVRDLLEISAVFTLILAAVWTPLGQLNSVLVALATASVIVFALRGRWSASEMGLTRPGTGAVNILLIGGLVCAVIALTGIP